MWQGQELKDDFTLEEYNVNFGAILKLVLGVKVGPLAAPPPPLWASVVNRPSSADKRTSDDDDDDSRPLTVLVFRDGDQIRLFTISTNTSATATAGTTTGTHDKSSPSTRPSSRARKRREADSLREKMTELQSRMASLNLRRSRLAKISSNHHPNQRKEDTMPSTYATTKLPAISKSSVPPTMSNIVGNSHVAYVSTKSHSPINLPPLVNNHNMTTNICPSPNINPHHASEKQDPLVNKWTRSLTTNYGLDPQVDHKSEDVILNDGHGFDHNHKITNIDTLSNRLRSNSYGHEKLCGQLNKLDTNRLFYKLSSSGSGSKNFDQNETSSVGSILEPVLRRNRPRTSPLVGNISSTRKIPDFIRSPPSEETIKNIRNGSGRNSRLLKKRAAKNATNSPLKRSAINQIGFTCGTKTRSPRLRCSQCRRKLPLVARYECRCNKWFCAKHRYSEEHECDYDYMSEGRRLIAANNPKIQASKLPKI